MKLITAVVKPHQVEEIKEALAPLGVQGMTVTEAQGFGRQGGHTETYRGTEYKVAFTPKSRLEIVVAKEHANEAVEAVMSAARTGKIGDGKIWVSSVERLVRIRTGEEGHDAL
ncbi:MAG: P-II family nitrogen regulator [Acidimicrobiales bacterium]